MSIWCPGSSEKVYAAVRMTQCPECGKLVDVTARGHIKPHVESKIAGTAKAAVAAPAKPAAAAKGAAPAKAAAPAKK